MFGLFKNRNKRPTIELTPEQDKFLGSAIEIHNNNNDILHSEWGFGGFEEWGFDQDSCVFFIRHEDGSGVEGRGQIYGSYSEPSGSWEWAWNNSMVSDTVSLDARNVKEYGEREDLEYLTTGIIPIPDEISATYLASVGEKINDAQGVFPGDAGAIKVFIGLYDLKKISESS